MFCRMASGCPVYLLLFSVSSYYHIMSGTYIKNDVLCMGWSFLRPHLSTSGNTYDGTLQWYCTASWRFLPSTVRPIIVIWPRDSGTSRVCLGYTVSWMGHCNGFDCTRVRKISLTRDVENRIKQIRYYRTDIGYTTHVIV